MVEGPVGATDGSAGDAVPDPSDAGLSGQVVPDVDWAARAASV